MVYLLPFFYPDKGKEHQVVDKCIIKKQKNKGLGQKKIKKIIDKSFCYMIVFCGKKYSLFLYRRTKIFQSITSDKYKQSI